MVDRARHSCWGGPGFDSRWGRPLPTGWVGVSIMWPAETEVMVSQLCLMFGSTQNFQTLCLGARPRYGLVVDEDQKKKKKTMEAKIISSLVILHLETTVSSAALLTGEPF